MRKVQDARKGHEDKEMKLKPETSNEWTRQNGANEKSEATGEDKQCIRCQEISHTLLHGVYFAWNAFGKIHDLNTTKCSKVSTQHVAQWKFVMQEVAMKEKLWISNTDDHVSAWGARPAYQQDLSEPQNEGGRLGDPARAGEPGGATGTIVKTSPGWLGGPLGPFSFSLAIMENRRSKPVVYQNKTNVR